MSDDLPDTVPVACPECGTSKVVDTDRSHDVVSTHNDKRHDGEPVAGIRVRLEDGTTQVLPHFDDVAEALGGGSE